MPPPLPDGSASLAEDVVVADSEAVEGSGVSIELGMSNGEPEGVGVFSRVSLEGTELGDVGVGASLVVLSLNDVGSSAAESELDEEDSVAWLAVLSLDDVGCNADESEVDGMGSGVWRVLLSLDGAGSGVIELDAEADSTVKVVVAV